MTDCAIVLSRTLFVGGVTYVQSTCLVVAIADVCQSSTDEHLRGIFTQFGQVQTCIVNTDKRHAFVKMISRTDAVRAKEGMEHFRSSEMQLRVCFKSLS